ncbi:hypothetical protein NPIL_323031 [Nephila pilipes]|uniref:Uncharacterized protein n=1 Tax=Nephila pilipes TaxID=299642 RepID=A0A8X6MQ94_NEPPI|nr:hypothetical protein NPIL_323031 [Nephila pilipes]
MGNREKKIRTLSDPKKRNYVSGFLNPTDLHSSGWSVEALCKSRWWERPSWHRKNSENGYIRLIKMKMKNGEFLSPVDRLHSIGVNHRSKNYRTKDWCSSRSR